MHTEKCLSYIWSHLVPAVHHLENVDLQVKLQLLSLATAMSHLFLAVVRHCIQRGRTCTTQAADTLIPFLGGL